MEVVGWTIAVVILTSLLILTLMGCCSSKSVLLAERMEQLRGFDDLVKLDPKSDVDEAVGVCNDVLVSGDELGKWGLAMESVRLGLVCCSLYLLRAGKTFGGAAELRSRSARTARCSRAVLAPAAPPAAPPAA